MAGKIEINRITNANIYINHCARETSSQAAPTEPRRGFVSALFL
ncbi:hypothetical protein ABD440_03490 [Chromobacterium piscinae]